MATIFTLIVALAMAYGLYLSYGFLRNQWKRAGMVAAGVLVSAAAMAPSSFTHAQESTPILDFNLDPFFESLNQYLPIFIGLFAIIGGIAGAMALARYVIGAVVRAFSGSGNI